MSAVRNLKNRLEKVTPGSLFSIDSLDLERSTALRQALSRMEKSGEIRRLNGGQGIYYIPKEGLLGEVKPSQSQILEMILKTQKKGYQTGISLFNKLGLTTQVPSYVTIATESAPQTTTIGGLKVKFLKSRASISRKSTPLLQLLDMLSNINKVPDSSPETIFNFIKKRLFNLEDSEKSTITSLSLKYPKRVQALLGAYFESNGYDNLSEKLKENLNSDTVYKIGFKQRILPNLQKWNIQ